MRTAAARRLFTDMDPLDMSESNGVTPGDVTAIEDEMLTMFEQAVRAAIFDLPIGENVDYSRGYSAAVAENRRALLETIGDLRKGRP